MKFSPVVAAPSRETIEQRKQSAAYWITQVGSPPVTALTTATFLVTLTQAVWFGVFALLVIAAPLLFVWQGVRTGRISDIHMPHPGERIKPLLFSILTTALAYGLIRLYGGPELLGRFTLINLLLSAIFLAVTLWFKISLHTASAAILCGVAYQLSDGVQVAGPISILLLIAWSRLHLKRHTFPQVAAGALTGLLLAGMV